MNRRTKFSSFLLTPAFLFVVLHAQRLPSGDEVLRNVIRGVEGVEDYTVTLQATLSMEHVRIPRATATMYFKKPDKIHFDSPGIAMLPREGIAFNSAAVLDQYTAQMVGRDTAMALQVYKLQLAAKSATARLRQLFVWVNPDNWTIVRLQTIPYEGRTVTVDFVYALQERKYWMPVATDAQFGVIGNQRTPQVQGDSAAPENPAEQLMPRGPRTGSISISYSGYKINTGLSDDIFKPAQAK